MPTKMYGNWRCLNAGVAFLGLFVVDSMNVKIRSISELQKKFGILFFVISNSFKKFPFSLILRQELETKSSLVNIPASYRFLQLSLGILVCLCQCANCFYVCPLKLCWFFYLSYYSFECLCACRAIHVRTPLFHCM